MRLFSISSWGHGLEKLTHEREFRSGRAVIVGDGPHPSLLFLGRLLVPESRRKQRPSAAMSAADGASRATRPFSLELCVLLSLACQPSTHLSGALSAWP